LYEAVDENQAMSIFRILQH